MSTNPYEGPEKRGDWLPPPSRGCGHLLVQVAVVLASMVILVALFLPAKRGAREAARRSACRNNLKQIGLGLHNYVDEHGTLPPVYTVDKEGNRLHSWRTLILPYMEWGRLYEKIDLTKPWNDPANREAYETVIDAYRCPSAVLDGPQTVYLAVAIEGACFQPGESRSWDDITDGTNETLIITEVNVDQAVHWMEPTDADEAWLNSLTDETVHSHPGGFNVLFADGSNHFIAADLEAATLRALISIAGGEAAHPY